MDTIIKVIAIHSVKYNGKWFMPNEQISLPDELAIALKKQGSVRFSDGELVEENEYEVIKENELFDGLTKEEIIEELSEVEGVSDSVAEALFGMGVYGIAALSQMTVEQLTPIKGVSDKKAQVILDSTADFTEVE